MKKAIATAFFYILAYNENKQQKLCWRWVHTCYSNGRGTSIPSVLVWKIWRICSPIINIVWLLRFRSYEVDGSMNIDTDGLTKEWLNKQKEKLDYIIWYDKPEDHWSCIAHLTAEDMLKSAVIEETKFKHSP